MRIWFRVINAPPETANYWVDASGPWGSKSRSGYYPSKYFTYIDIGPSGTISCSANPSGKWSHPGIIPGGSAPYSNLQEKVEYDLDFNTGVLTPRTETPEEEEEFPKAAEHPLAFALAILTPWGPLSGPPLPRIFPPWPWGMSTWKEFWGKVT